MYYVSFDAYYRYDLVNDFLVNAEKNGLKFRTFISNRDGYKWYIGLDYKRDFPKFLKYTEVTDTRFLFEKLTPMNGAERNYLLRRSQIVDIEQFVSPKCFKELKNKDYAVCFKYNNLDTIKQASLVGIKSYLLGKQGNYRLGLSFNKYINNYISLSDIMLEKKNKSQYSNPLEFEYSLCIKWNFRMKNKMLHYPTIEKGGLIYNASGGSVPTGFFS